MRSVKPLQEREGQQWPRVAGRESVPATKDRDKTQAEKIVRETVPSDDSFVYCKGCGGPLESRSKLLKPRVFVEYMMCESCRESHGHAMMPSPGSPTYCFRCGRKKEIFVEPSVSPITHHLCVHCLPERAQRYRSGDFAPPPKDPVEGESHAKTAAR
jgi:hypothetical protein